MTDRPEITVITAVWHRQRDKLDLLRGHVQNLAAQTVAVRSIYVFDAGDAPPDWLPGLKIAASEELTIYKAWNLALAATETAYVANLNLDDRFAPNALERMAAALKTNPDVFLVGGDWLVCHTQQETDAVAPAYEAADVPTIDQWPPRPVPGHRLGSSQAGTMGPACLWRMAAHMYVPRYPYRMADGRPIRMTADALWWNLIQSHMKKKLLRLPYVIGNYRSWPQTQAEFRLTEPENFDNQPIALL